MHLTSINFARRYFTTRGTAPCHYRRGSVETSSGILREYAIYRVVYTLFFQAVNKDLRNTQFPIPSRDFDEADFADSKS